jgi:hypothetical protein
LSPSQKRALLEVDETGTPPMSTRTVTLQVLRDRGYIEWTGATGPHPTQPRAMYRPTTYGYYMIRKLKGKEQDVNDAQNR